MAFLQAPHADVAAAGAIPDSTFASIESKTHLVAVRCLVLEVGETLQNGRWRSIGLLWLLLLGLLLLLLLLLVLGISVADIVRTPRWRWRSRPLEGVQPGWTWKKTEGDRWIID